MQLWKSWVIATKDFSVFRKKKRILYSLIILPLLLSIGLPVILRFIARTAQPAEIAVLLGAFSFFYIVLTYIVSSPLAAYSILGEKIEQSMEPLLATPTTDGELLLGKTIATFLPSVGVIYISAVIFMVLSDLFTYNEINYLFFPNWIFAFILLLVVPLATILSIQLNVIISSRVNDVRTANQIAFLLFIPFFVLYVSLEANLVSLNIINLLVIFATLILIDLVLFFISKALFRRDEILTKWK